MLDGEQVVVTPAGTETAVNAMVPVKPPLAWKLTVDAPDWPPANETLVGFDDRPKFAAVTVTATVAEWTRAPLVPGTVPGKDRPFFPLGDTVHACLPLIL